MRLVRYTQNNGEIRLGAFVKKGVLDLQATARTTGIQFEPFANISSFLAAGDAALREATKLLQAASQAGIAPLADVHLLAPVPNPGKIIAVGLNYRDHSMESGAKEPPKSPLIFAKFPTSISGPGDDILLPAGDPQVDYEAELAVVIGRKGKAISAGKALDFIAGYMPLNDVSARAWQFADKQWVRGKSCDTFCPTGPYLTTRDDVPDPHALSICTRVNGATLQDSNTAKMIFRIPELIEYISASITLGSISAAPTKRPFVGQHRREANIARPRAVHSIQEGSAHALEASALGYPIAGAIPAALEPRPGRR